MNNSKLTSSKPSSGTSEAGARAIPIDANQRIDSGDLFVDTREITIGHGSETYRLRLTAQNKLILTK